MIISQFKLNIEANNTKCFILYPAREHTMERPKSVFLYIPKRHTAIRKPVSIAGGCAETTHSLARQRLHNVNLLCYNKSNITLSYNIQKMKIRGLYSLLLPIHINC